MKVKNLYILLLFGALLPSCYDDYIDDYEYSSVGFAIEKPLRTVIADRDMEIRVGVSIGGKRAVDMSDWATFLIVPDSVPAGKTLLPESYYTLSDPATMRVQKSNLPVADVGIKFTDDFYSDPDAISGKYVLPFTIIDSSLDSVFRASTIVCFKYISTFHGTYYVKGQLHELDAPAGNIVNTTAYSESDLTRNITRDISTLDRYTLVRPGVANFTLISAEKVQLKIVPDGNADKTYSIEVGTASGGVTVTDGSGTYYGNKANPEMELRYAFVKGGKNYRVEETLILRQDPLYDLRVETWQ
ncbi:MAG: DUF1735 domain-containing protein [Prevotella sp.]|nr:DUF1735 domain-containing protein [Prevotella sp.]